MQDPSWTDIAGVGILGVQLLVLIAAAIFAWHQVREARRLREEQNRPFVVIDFETDDETRTILLKVSNIGTSLARDVRFEINPPLEAAIELVPFSDVKMFREGISTLAPGKVIRTIFDSSVQRFPRRGELPDVYDVRVRYTDERGKRSFDEQLDLDLGLFWSLTHVTRHGLHDINKRLEQIHKEMKKWTAGSSGMLRLSPAEASERNERQLRELGID